MVKKNDREISNIKNNKNKEKTKPNENKAKTKDIKKETSKNKSHEKEIRKIDGDECVVLDEYKVSTDNVEAKINIHLCESEYVPEYKIIKKEISSAVRAIMSAIKDELIDNVDLTVKEFVDPSSLTKVKEKFMARAKILFEKYLPYTSEEDKMRYVGTLIHEMLGLGDIELLLADPHLEEIVINGAKQPVWVYHKKHNWVKTSLIINTEDEIYNIASSIGRRVGRQITNLDPLMDAHLPTGDRVNATLFPISSKGNTITIRKFSRSPWTIIHFLESKTLSYEVASLLWLAIQYEMNILVAGGTASGKTSMLNVLMPFMPANHRIISIEDTREINLPDFLHWVPFSSREANPEGKGAVTMLDLLANSLRMRPDRIIIGEIRRQKEAEVMFEAIRTGHSAYATFHGDKADEVRKRLINPPMNLPPSVLSALHLIVVQYRHRRLGIRRTLEVAEILPVEDTVKLNLLYRWDPKQDILQKENKSYRIFEDITMYTGMSEQEIEEDIKDKITILKWMEKNNVKTINTVGKIVAEYYKNKKHVVEYAKNNKNPKDIIGSILFKEIENLQ